MKCEEEVMDWMQRYVDHELDEEETSQLMNHIATCPDCAEKFHILQTLSRELEELPAVSPAFSLVDSIMPQLDAIDRAREEQGSALQEMQPVSVDLGPGPRQRTRPTPWWNRMGGRAAMGIAAAAIVLGIVVFNFEPKTVQDAEGILTSQSPEATSQQNPSQIPDTTNGSEGRDAAIGAESTKPSLEQGQGTDASQAPVAKVPDSSEQGLDSVDRENNSSSPDAAKRDHQRAGKEDSTNSAQAGPSSRVERKQGEPDAGSKSPVKKLTQDAPKSDDKPSVQEKSKQPPIATDQPKESSMEKASMVDADSAQGNTNDSTVADDPPSLPSQELKAQNPTASDGTSQDTTSRSITKGSRVAVTENNSQSVSNDQQSSVPQDSMRKEGFVSNSLVTPGSNSTSTFGTQSASADQFNSPDGSYAVVVEGKKLKVYKLSDNGVDRTTLEVRTLKGTWVKGSWSEDSQTFIYETEQDGTASKYTYTVPRGTGK